MVIKQGEQSYSSGSTYSDLTSLIGTSVDVVFTIENPGTAALNLVVDPVNTNSDRSPAYVTRSGSDENQFSIQTQPSSPIDIGGTSTFTLRFTPTSSGTKNVILTLLNDSGQNPYTLNISASVQEPEPVVPEINVKEGSTSYAAGSTFSFSTTEVGSTTNATFTIENLGNGELNLTGTPRVAVSGVDASQFTVTAQPDSPVGASGSTFTVQFAPTSVGTKTAKLTIDNNDSNESSYEIILEGTATNPPAPEIRVKVDGTTYAAGTAVPDLGTLYTSDSPQDITVTIENSGDATLNFSGSLDTDSSPEFALVGSTSGAVDGTPATLTLRFTPTSTGAKTAKLIINNNDSNENPYVLTFSGTVANPAVPEIDVQVQGQPDTNVHSYDFGTVYTGGGQKDITFTILNTGNADLTLSGNPALSGSSNFTVVDNPNMTVSGPNGSTSVTVRFTPTGNGVKSSTLTIASNDSDEGSYTISLQGTAADPPAPEIDVTQNGTSLASGASFAFGSQVVGSSSGAIEFEIQNSGTAPLTLSGNPRVALTGSGSFTVSAQPSSGSVAEGASEKFSVQFTPSSGGDKTATLTITNNDSNEDPYTITLTGHGLAPEIDVQQGGAPFASGQTYTYSGTTLTGGGTADATFTIANTGDADLHLTGSPKVTSSSSEFVVLEDPTSPVAGTLTSFTVRFTPTAPGLRTASLTIANDDSDEGSYVINLSGQAADPAPEINVKQGTASYAVSSTYSYANTAVGATTDAAFTIENLGNGVLSLTGSPLVALSGTNANQFSVTAQPSSPVGVGSTTTFTVRFAPTSAGTKTAVLTIANNDSDEGTYTINLSGVGQAPEINVKQGPTSYAVNSAFTYTPTTTGTTRDATLTIENLGSATLNLTGSPVVALSGADAGQFSVTTQPNSSVSAGGSTTFTVRFAPSSVGIKTAVLTIANNDLDEGAYTINLTGQGITPEINVKQGTTSYATNSTFVYPGGPFLPGSNNSITFTIENLSTGILSLTGSPRVAVSGADAGQFSVTTQPGSSVNGVGNTTFTVRFTPSSVGIKTATLTIANNDLDENPYIINLSGESQAPEINVKQGIVSYAVGSTFTPAATLVGTTTDVSFTIENLGGLALNLTGVPKVALSGINANQFSVTAQPSSPVVAGGTTAFTVQFKPTSAGTKTAVLTIANNDSDEGTYTINLSGVGTTPEINVKQGPTSYAVGSTATFTPTAAGTSADLVFTIENTGNGNLNLTGSPLVALSGTNASQYSIVLQPSTPVSAGSNTTFTVRFSPISAGTKTAVLTIANNDSDEGSYTVNLSGVGQSTEPTQQPSVSATGIGPTWVQFSLTGGNGAKRLAVIRATSTAAAPPTDGSIYTAGTRFGQGSSTGTGNTVLIAGTATTSFVSNLTPSTSYTLEVYSYNEAGGNTTNYLTTAPGSVVASTPAPVYTANFTTAAWTSSSGDPGSANMWTPARIDPTGDDVLVINRGNANMVTVNYQGTETIKQLIIQAPSQVTFNVLGSTTSSLTLLGASNALQIPATSSIIFDAATDGSMIMQLGPGAITSISGSIEFKNNNNNRVSAHRLQGSQAGAITFLSGSKFLATKGFSTSGSAFGASVANSVIFQSGATYRQQAGSAPFGMAEPASAVDFQSGSTYEYAMGAGSSLECSGRKYGHLICETGSSSTALFTLPMTILNNLTLQSGTVNMNAAKGVSIGGNLLVAGGKLVLIPNGNGANDSPNLAVSGDLTVNNGAECTYAPNGNANQQGSFSVGGHLTVNGTGKIDCNPTPKITMKMNGTAGGQLIRGTGTFICNAVMIIDNMDGVTLQKPITLPRGIDLSRGLLHTDDVNILTMPSTAPATGGSRISFVDGPMIRTLNISGVSTSLAYPIGRISAYRPLTLTLTQAGAALTSYKAEQIESGAPILPYIGEIKRVSGVRHFKISKVAGGTSFTDGIVTLSYGTDSNRDDQVDAPAKLRVAKTIDSETKWLDLGGTGSGVGTGTITSTTRFSTFSLFALASVAASANSGDNPLPVTWAGFTATVVEAGVQLDWQTATELNTDRFEVQRSQDGYTFRTLQSVPAAGNSTALRRYQALDETTLTGLTYYRIRQLDQTGAESFTSVLSVRGGKLNAAVYPNPVTDKLNYKVNEAVTRWRISDGVGRTLSNGHKENGSSTIDVSKLAPGVYFLELRTLHGTSMHRFVKE
ncbi:choice-of-anchor D domain-containing protein [Hymenobacter sp. BT730]|uniref:choice-of-anchor D domain-containing protein n=1 Tax=Hymenobacter sp. BT730 TaxID=3063332 RepID=UPI0026E04A5A|nr:choice-of-anchor D domain-containing protein [Hymenobacter sp. BT730]